MTKCLWVYFWALYSIPSISVSVLHQYHIAVMIIAFQYSLKSRHMIFPVLFFLKIALAICHPLWFNTVFRIISSSSVKNAIDILIGFALTLYISSGIMGSLTILILPIYEGRIFPFICGIFNFFHLCLIVFRLQVFHLYGQICF